MLEHLHENLWDLTGPAETRDKLKGRAEQRVAEGLALRPPLRLQKSLFYNVRFMFS